MKIKTCSNGYCINTARLHVVCACSLNTWSGSARAYLLNTSPRSKEKEPENGGDHGAGGDQCWPNSTSIALQSNKLWARKIRVRSLWFREWICPVYCSAALPSLELFPCHPQPLSLLLPCPSDLFSLIVHPPIFLSSALINVDTSLFSSHSVPLLSHFWRHWIIFIIAQLPPVWSPCLDICLFITTLSAAHMCPA